MVLTADSSPWLPDDLSRPEASDGGSPSIGARTTRLVTYGKHLLAGFGVRNVDGSAFAQATTRWCVLPAPAAERRRPTRTQATPSGEHWPSLASRAPREGSARRSREGDLRCVSRVHFGSPSIRSSIRLALGQIPVFSTCLAGSILGRILVKEVPPTGEGDQAQNGPFERVEPTEEVAPESP